MDGYEIHKTHRSDTFPQSTAGFRVVTKGFRRHPQYSAQETAGPPSYVASTSAQRKLGYGPSGVQKPKGKMGTLLNTGPTSEVQKLRGKMGTLNPDLYLDSSEPLAWGHHMFFIG